MCKRENEKAAAKNFHKQTAILQNAILCCIKFGFMCVCMSLPNESCHKHRNMLCGWLSSHFIAGRGWLLVSKLSPASNALAASPTLSTRRDVGVSHRKVQMSPLNAAMNSNDNSMLMTLTLCQANSSSSSSNGNRKFCQQAWSIVYLGRPGHLSCPLGRLAALFAA